MTCRPKSENRCRHGCGVSLERCCVAPVRQLLYFGNSPQVVFPKQVACCSTSRFRVRGPRQLRQLRHLWLRINSAYPWICHAVCGNATRFVAHKPQPVVARRAWRSIFHSRRRCIDTRPPECIIGTCGSLPRTGSVACSGLGARPRASGVSGASRHHDDDFLLLAVCPTLAACRAAARVAHALPAPHALAVNLAFRGVHTSFRAKYEFILDRRPPAHRAKKMRAYLVGLCVVLLWYGVPIGVGSTNGAISPFCTHRRIDPPCTNHVPHWNADAVLRHGWRRREARPLPMSPSRSRYVRSERIVPECA